MYILAAHIAASPLQRLTERCCQIFCLALFFTVCVFHFFLVIKTTKPKKTKTNHQTTNHSIKYNNVLFFFFFRSVRRLGSGLRGPCRAPCQGTGKERGQRHKKLMLGKDALGKRKALSLSKTNWQRKSWMERKESFSTRLAQQTLSPKNLTVIHYTGFVAKKFPLSRAVRSTCGGGVTRAMEVQSSLLSPPGTQTVCTP